MIQMQGSTYDSKGNTVTGGTCVVESAMPLYIPDSIWHNHLVLHKNKSMVKRVKGEYIVTHNKRPRNSMRLQSILDAIALKSIGTQQQDK
jgi:dTDP-4-dehydrorhamnose 3,5-epimerase-like enzyme